MKRWHCITSKYIENKKIDAFLQEVIAVCKKHGYSISHEDRHGAFEIELADENNFSWLLGSSDGT